MNLILESVLDGLYVLMAAISNVFYFILPTVSLPITITAPIALIATVLYPISWVIPLQTIGICLFTIATVFTGLAMYRFIKFVISAIPFI